MGVYAEHILPHLIGVACSQKPIRRQREILVPGAEGRVLEVGLGAGPNLEFYDPGKVERIFALEPSSGMRRKAAKALAAAPVPVELIDLPGEEIPLEDDSVDTVVLTFTLCTIDDTAAALGQMHRVMRPNAKLLFCEHGAAPDAGVARWQARFAPAWQALGGGCRLNRAIPELIVGAGFSIGDLQTGYLDKTPKFAGYNYWGWAGAR